MIISLIPSLLTTNHDSGYPYCANPALTEEDLSSIIIECMFRRIMLAYNIIKLYININNSTCISVNNVVLLILVAVVVTRTIVVVMVVVIATGLLE